MILYQKVYQTLFYDQKALKFLMNKKKVRNFWNFAVYFLNASKILENIKYLKKLQIKMLLRRPNTLKS